MARSKLSIVIIQLMISFCLCELNLEEKVKLVNGFVRFYNNLPNQIYTCDQGYLLNAQQTDISTYKIDVTLKVSHRHNQDVTKYLKCSANVADVDNNYEDGVLVVHNECQELKPNESPSYIDEFQVTSTTEAPFVHKPVQLDNEVQTDTAVTSGEQFIAVPREEPKTQCVGCSSHVNPQAEGVSEMAAIGIRQLNFLKPNTKHSLNSVVDVERQVQVVNGIRYIMTLIVDCDSCSTTETNACMTSNVCKITILEKPWMQLPDGSKYRAILTNNCTEEWRFGDDGVVIPKAPTDNRENNINPSNPDDSLENVIKPVTAVNVESQQQSEKVLTDQDIKNIEEQIISHNQDPGLKTLEADFVSSTTKPEESKYHVTIDSNSQKSANIPPSKSQKFESLEEDKKKAIDDLINFFNFADLDLNTNVNEAATRIKRSFNSDLHILHLAEKYYKLRKSIDNSKYIYMLAQAVVDYMNEMDLEVKNRILKDVTNSEKESENHNNFYYLQFRTVIPCQNNYCVNENALTKICNAIIDDSEKTPQILNVFCHAEDKKKYAENINMVPLDDPVLLNLINETIKTMELESPDDKALKLSKIIEATTQKVSGTLTKVSVVLEETDCNKSLPIKSRSDCPVLEKAGSKICDVTIHERHWIKERKITYTCTDRPIDISFTKSGEAIKRSIRDPIVFDILQEALRFLDDQSDRNNKQVVVRVNSVSTQLVAGFLTSIDFVVGYTTCESNIKIEESGNCKLLENEPLRNCKAKVWDKTWLEDEKQIEVTCSDTDSMAVPQRKKRSVISVNRRPGAPIDQDPNDQKYKQLAEESLQKYLQDSGNSQEHKVVSVEKVTVQVVAGILTKIKFKIVSLTSTSGDVISCNSEIWEKSWENFKDIQVRCEIDDKNSRVKNLNNPSKDTNIRDRPSVKTINKPVKHDTIVGGPVAVDSNDQKYKQLAEESLQKYLQDSGNSQNHKVVSVENVTVQVVAGTITKINFKIAPFTPTSGDTISCTSEIWEKPWENFKDIKVSCEIDDTNSRVENLNKRSVKNLNTAIKDDTIVGGPVAADINDQKYKQLAEESLQKYLQNTGNSQLHKVVSVENVTVQIVAGTLTTINFKIASLTPTSGDTISCTSKIWEKIWEHFKDIQVSCEIDDTNSRVENLNKRSVKSLNTAIKHDTIVGGPVAADINDQKYKQLAEESLQKYLQNTGNSQLHKVVSLENVTVQIVAGTLTTINFKIAPLTPTSGNTISCTSKIWEKIWEHFKDIQVSCEIDNTNNRVDRNLVAGGMREQDPSSSQYRLLAEQSLEKYLLDSGNTEFYKVFRIKKVTTQVVAGTRTIIDFIISPKTTSHDFINCKSDIWQQPWLNKTEIKINCEFNNNQLARNKREITYSRTRKGGIIEEDPTKAKYKEMAEGSLNEYRKHYGNLDHHVVAQVKKVTTQIASGTIYTIDFTAAPTSCADNIKNCDDITAVLNCHSIVKQRPFPRLTDTDVSCRHHKAKTRGVHFENAEGSTKANEYPDIEISRNDGSRQKRQADEDYIEEDIKFYYAERAIQHLNERTKSNNLYKLITIHAIQNSMHMDNTPMVRMYIETAQTFCLRHLDENNLSECEEMDAMNHKLCLARLWPSQDDEMVIQLVAIVCDDEDDFESISGISMTTLVKASIKSLEKPRDVLYKLVHLGEPQLIPTLDTKLPFKLNFIVASTNCSKKIEVPSKHNCFVDTTKPAKACTSYIWLAPNSRTITKVTARCTSTESRQRRSISLNPTNATADDLVIQKLVQESLDKLEMSTPQRYKQKVLKINGYSTKITSGKATTIDFDVGFTSCLKYSWIDNINNCDLMEHLPRRHCVSEVWERLWLENGRNIQVVCKDEEVPIEAHVEFESAALAQTLANRALKHIEAKYPHPRKQKVVRIFSLEKQVVAGVHYQMKVEVGVTNCSALSIDDYCITDKKGGSENKFCKVNVWLRPWTDHPPIFRVSCDYHEGAMADMYHKIQAEHLFRDFVATYMPDYIHDYEEMNRRFEIFEKNVQKMHEFNTHERGTATYGVTRFADLTYEEFTAKHLGLKPNLTDHNQVPMRKAVIPNGEIPLHFDWRELGAVTPVKNQGSCGSCWAFSVTGNIEGQWQLKSGVLVPLSEQELVDCDTMDQGCNGGLPDNAYRAIEQLGGLETENDYPYEGEDDKCAFNKTVVKVQISGAVNISSNETDMAKWLVFSGPISIGINANAMQFYMGGVSHPWKMLCNPNNLDHGVLIVGYGTKYYPLFNKQLPFWIVKNSWGPSWGEQGYYRVYRGDGTCGLNMMASSAVI